MDLSLYRSPQCRIVDISFTSFALSHGFRTMEFVQFVGAQGNSSEMIEVWYRYHHLTSIGSIQLVQSVTVK